MKRVVFFISVFSLLLVAITNASQSRAFRGILDEIEELSHNSGKLGPYRALIIGIDDYEDEKIPDLETAVNDAKMVGQILEDKYGFRVNYLLGQKATRESIYTAFRNLAETIKPNENILIYYAGHGDIDKVYNDGWWIPADAKAGKPLTYFDNVQVQKAMRTMAARHVLLISDSCYSGTLFGQARELPPIVNDRYYLDLYNEKSRWGMTSGNKTPVSDTGTGGHSVFAYQLIKALKKNKKPYLSTQELYTQIAPIVSNNSEQTPMCRPIRNTGDQGGEFVFVASVMKEKIEQSGTSSVSREASPVTSGIELAFWQSIQNSDDVSLFEAYLERFPEGVFAPIAKRKLKIERKSTAEVQREQESLKTEQNPPADKQKEPERLEVEQKSLPEEQKEKVVVASIDPKIREIGRDDHYIAYENGVVWDSRTDLEWLVCPIKSTLQYTVKQWVKKLTVAGGSWRMPTIEELKTLYDKSKGVENITRLLLRWKDCVWSSTSGMAFSFRNGYYLMSVDDALNPCAGFAVRPKKQVSLEAERSRPVPESQTQKEETPKYASISPDVSSPKEIDRDDHYIAYDNGVVLDTKTNLEWVGYPDSGMDWSAAQQWVKKLTVAGGGWRMPKVAELMTLYEKGRGTNEMRRIMRFFKLYDIRLWSSSSMCLFKLWDGYCESNYSQPVTLPGAIAVRSRR